MEERYLQILKNALEGIELSPDDAKTVKWIAGWGDGTVQRFVQIIKKCRNLQNPVKWIPVTERMPEEDTDYLVTMVTPGYFNGQPYTNWLCWYCDDEEWTDTDGDVIPEQDTVIAWMPVIRPYKPQN